MHDILEDYEHFLFVLHTYIHNWPLQPFSQVYWNSYSCHIFKSTPNDRFFEKVFMSVFVRNLVSLSLSLQYSFMYRGEVVLLPDDLYYYLQAPLSIISTYKCCLYQSCCIEKLWNVIGIYNHLSKKLF